MNLAERRAASDGGRCLSWPQSERFFGFLVFDTVATALRPHDCVSYTCHFGEPTYQGIWAC